MRKSDIFYPFKNSRDSLNNFSTLSTGYFSCRLTLTLTFFGCLMKPEAMEGAFQNGNTGLFFILMNKCNLGTNLYPITNHDQFLCNVC